MDAYGLLTCNGKQTFSAKVVIGKGRAFAIGPIWTRSYPFDSNFQMSYFAADSETESMADLTASTSPTVSPSSVKLNANLQCRIICRQRRL
jgi:hypothetical protein